MVPSRVLLVLFLLASPLAAALGEPQPVGQVRHFPSGGDTRSPRLAWNGGWLVTWGNAEGAARISAAGEPVDLPAILVHERPAHTAAGVVPADDGWLVGSVGRGFIDLHRINSDGEVVALETRSIPFEEGWFHSAWMVRTSGDVVVGWSYEENTYLYSVERNQILTVQGRAVDLAGAGDRIFLALRDRVVEIGSALEIRRSLLLPDSLAVLDLVEDGGGVKVITLDARIASSDVPWIRIQSIESSGFVEIAAFSTPARPAALRAAYSGKELLLAWKVLRVPALNGFGPHDLFAARVGPSGLLEGPILIEEHVDETGRSFRTVDSFAVGGDVDGWMIVRSEGFATAGDVLARRIAHGRPLQPGSGAVANWRAPDQILRGTATRGETTLVVWSESTPSRRRPRYGGYAARFSSDGERLDPDDLPLPAIHGVAVSPDGFLLFGYDTVYLLRESSSAAEPLPATRAGFSSFACAGEICFDATLVPVFPSEVRVTRRRGSEALDPEGVVIATGWSDGVSVASDGRGFLVAGSRREGEGTIQTFARVSVDGEVTSRGDFAASPRALTLPLLVWTGEHYVAIWKDGVELRTMRITSEGLVLDGDSTGWEGIRTGVAGAEVWRVEGPEGAGTILVELPGGGGEYVIAPDGSLMPAGPLPRGACDGRGACLRAFNAEVTGDPWFKADRLFLQTETRNFRGRPVRRP